jgi:hypothetical protein
MIKPNPSTSGMDHIAVDILVLQGWIISDLSGCLTGFFRDFVLVRGELDNSSTSKCHCDGDALRRKQSAANRKRLWMSFTRLIGARFESALRLIWTSRWIGRLKLFNLSLLITVFSGFYLK